MNDQFLWLDPPYEKDQKIEKCQTFNFDEYPKYFLYSLLYLRNILYLAQMMRALLSNKNGILHFEKSQ